MKIAKILAGCLVASVISGLPVKAADKSPLRLAQEYEVSGKYTLAASAYLAIADGYDFMPGETKDQKQFSIEEKAILGNCAIYCLEQAIRQHDSGSADPQGAIENQLLQVARKTVERLKPASKHNDKSS